MQNGQNNSGNVENNNMEQNKEIKFRCTPVQQQYYSDDSCFGVFKFYTKDDIPQYEQVRNYDFNGGDGGYVKSSTLAGTMQELYTNAEYDVVATLEYSEKYKSWQYNPITITPIIPKTEEQQKKFLRTIITEKQAETLLEKYPNIVEDIVNQNDDVDLTTLKGIKEKTYSYIRNKVLENYSISNVLALLQPFGVKYNTVKRLLKSEPNPEILKQNLINDPYILSKYHGVGFKTADAIAKKLNPKLKVSTTRVYAFIKYYLNKISEDEGHTWVPLETLENAVRDNMLECMDIYNKIINDEQEHEIILHFGSGIVGLKYNYWLEKNIYAKLKEIQKVQPLKLTQKNITDGIAKAEFDLGFKLTEEQQTVIKNSLNDNVCVITGYAGSGKTTISRALLNIYSNAHYNIKCCALSAKASQRIIEATGFDASTIHRMLGVDKNGNFIHNHDKPLNVDVVLIDECSMINSSVYNGLLDAILPGTKIIMCGDNGQLPPIGCGNIFNDLLSKTKDFHIEKLTKVLRQAEKSGILSDANKIRKGIWPIKQPELKTVSGELQDMTYMFRDSREMLNNIAIKSYFTAIKQDGIDEVAIIVPRKNNCENSTLEINKKISNVLFDKGKMSLKHGEKMYYIGSKVVQTKNNYDKNVFNGEVGYITKIFKEHNEKGKDSIQFVVEYNMGDQTKEILYSGGELDQIDLAYAYTCHRAQGSGYKTVIIILDNTHYTLLDTCMLYTAITRAKKRCLLIAEPSAFKTCMYHNSSKNRQTWLSGMK